MPNLADVLRDVKGVVFDHTALLAFGAGHHVLTALVVRAHAEHGRRLFVPALCLAGATAHRPALGEHVGALPIMDVVELRYSGALAVVTIDIR